MFKLELNERLLIFRCTLSSKTMNEIFNSKFLFFRGLLSGKWLAIYNFQERSRWRPKITILEIAGYKSTVGREDTTVDDAFLTINHETQVAQGLNVLFSRSIVKCKLSIIFRQLSIQHPWLFVEASRFSVMSLWSTVTTRKPNEKNHF